MSITEYPVTEHGERFVITKVTTTYPGHLDPYHGYDIDCGECGTSIATGIESLDPIDTYMCPNCGNTP